MHPRYSTPSRLLAAMALAAALPAARPAAAQQSGSLSRDELAKGRAHYIASCARCHGVNGGGGEGPPLARAVLPRAPDDETLNRIIVTGIPGTAMGGTRWLSDEERRLVVGYVRSLAPVGGGPAPAGDAERGRALFERSGCSGCHTVGGFGTARGPDLTSVGVRRGPAYLRESVVDPAAALPRGQTAMPRDFVDYLMVRVVDRNGNEVRGMRMNEDSYTIQLKDTRGIVHSFYKPDLRALDKEFDSSLMRSYRDRFSDAELDDLVSYLMTLSGPESRMIS
jgi:cytochrome c oxidase cbb3-type subunit 3